MNTIKQFVSENKVLSTLLVLVAAGLLFVAMLVLSVNDDTAAASTEADSTVIMSSQMCENPGAAVRNLLLKQGFKNGQFVIGEDKFDLSLSEATEEGSGNFGSAATTSEKLTDFLGSSDPAAKEVLTHSVKAAGVTREQALDPNNWVGFQMLVKSKWEGNTAYSDGELAKAGTRKNAKGDLGWVLVNPNDCQKAERSDKTGGKAYDDVRMAHVRGGCVNPQFSPPTPDTPSGRTPNNPGGNPPGNPPSGGECPPGQVPYMGRCVKEASDDGVGGNDSPASQPVGENPQGGTPGAGSEPKPPKPGPKPVDGNPAPDPNPGGYDSGSGNGSGTPGGSTCDGSGCSGGGPKPADPGDPPVVDDGSHSGDPGGF